MLTNWMCLALVMQTLQVTRCQILNWRLGSNTCEVFVGETITLEAVLEQVQVDKMVSSVHKHILILELDESKNVCGMIIEQEGCVSTPRFCGNCLLSVNSIEMSFNFTAKYYGKEHILLLKYVFGDSITTSSTKHVWVQDKEKTTVIDFKTDFTHTWIFSPHGEIIENKEEGLSLLACHDEWKFKPNFTSIVSGSGRDVRLDEETGCVDLVSVNHHLNESVTFVYEDSRIKKRFKCGGQDLRSPDFTFRRLQITNVTNTGRTQVSWNFLSHLDAKFACYFGLEGKTDLVPGITKASNNSYTVPATPGPPSIYQHICSVNVKSSDIYGTHFNTSTHVQAGKISHSRERAVSCTVQSVPRYLNIPRLSPNCQQGEEVFQGYIRSKSEATCTCTADYPTHPSEQVQWFNNDGTKIGEAGKTATLNIPSGPDDKNMSYTCKTITQTKAEGCGVVFSPKFIVPASVTLSACPKGPWVKDEYIRIGTNARCTCKMSSAGSQPGLVEWFDSKGANLVQEESIAILTIPSGQNDKDQKYVCRGKTDLAPFTSETEFYPKLVGPVVTVKVNNKTSTVVDQGSNVTFSCEVESVFPAIAVLVGPGRGQIQEFRSQNQSLEFHLSNLTCADSGRYACRGDDGVDFKTLDSERFVDVNFTLQTKDSNKILEFYIKKLQNINIHIDVCGYPEPNNYTMMIKQNSDWLEVSRDAYKVNFYAHLIPFGMLVIEIGVKKTEEPTMYNLNVQNGVGKGVDIKFVVHTIKSKERDFWFPIGLAVGSCVFFFIILTISIYYMKQKISCAVCSLWKKTASPNHQQTSEGYRNRPLPETPDIEYSHYDIISSDSDDDYIDPIEPPYRIDINDPLHPSLVDRGSSIEMQQLRCVSTSPDDEQINESVV